MNVVWGWVTADWTHWFIVIFSLALALWTATSLSSLWLARQKLRRQLAAVQTAIDGALPLEADLAKQRQRFAAELGTIADKLQAQDLVRKPWAAYESTIVVTQHAGSPVVRSADEPSRWFNTNLFGAAGVDLRYHAAMPNLLVGTGLLATFFGLTVALMSAQGVVTGDSAARNAALSALLGAASLKFITSLAGMFLSIAYALARKRLIGRVETQISDVCVRLEELAPPITAVDLQNEALRLSERQFEQLQQFNSELASKIGDAVDERFDARLGDHIGPLRETIEALASKLSTGNEAAIETMLQQFTDKMQGGVGDRMSSVTQMLDTLAGRLDAMSGAFSGAAGELSSAASSIGAQLRDGGSSAAAELQSQMTSIASDLQRMMTEMTSGLAAEGQTQRSAMAEQVQAIVEQLKTLQSESQTAGAQATQELAQRMTSVASALERSAETIVERLSTGAEHSGERFKTQMDEGIGRLVGAAREAAETFEGAANKLGSTAGGLERGIQELERAAGSTAARMGDLQAAIKSAAEPLELGSREFARAGEAAKAAATPLAAAVQGFAEASRKVVDLGAQLSESMDEGKRFAASLGEAAKRFEGVDRSLAETLRSLQSGLDAYTSKVSEFTTRTNDSMAKAVDGLGGLVTELSNTIDDLVERRDPNSGGRS